MFEGKFICKIIKFNIFKPWRNENLDSISKPIIKVEIDKDGKVEVKESSIPAPKIAFVDGNTLGQATIYGVAVRKGQKKLNLKYGMLRAKRLAFAGLSGLVPITRKNHEK